MAEMSAPMDAVQEMWYISVPDFQGGTHMSPGGHSGAARSIACSVLEECTGLCEYTQALTPHTCYRDKFIDVHSSQTKTCNVRKLRPCVDEKTYLTLGCSGAKARCLRCLCVCERNWINSARVRCLSLDALQHVWFTETAVPGCYLLLWGLLPPANNTAMRERLQLF